MTRATLPVTLTFPWPSHELSGHAKGNWRGKADVTRKARNAAHWIALEAKLPCTPHARISFTYHPPAKGGLPDCQNMPGRCKPLVDGIASAMGCDDRGFRPQFPDHLAPRQGAGCVIVVVSE